MSTPRKVLPVSDEFTPITAMESTTENNESTLQDKKPSFANDWALTPNKPTIPGPTDTVVVKYLSETADEISSTESERDVIAPLRHLSNVHSSNPHITHNSKVHTAPLIKKASGSSKNVLADTIKRSASIRRLTSTSELLARQRQRLKVLSSKHHSVKDVAMYRIDQYISTRRGQTLVLAIMGALFVLIGGIIVKASIPSVTFDETIWMAWTYLGDPGSHTALIDPWLRFVGVMLTMLGILYFSVIMGFVVDGIRQKMDNLKKGKSKVAEERHTLMLGWTDKSISLIRQICLANASEKGGVIVVLADQEKEELEAELASFLRVDELHGSKVVFRTGTPLLSVDLLKVAAHRARSIIIMAQCTGDADRSDAAVLRTVLSLKTLPELSGHMVVELRDIDNEPLVRLVGGNDVEVLVSHDVIGRLVLTAARSPGLARVFSCLLGFDGNEFYFKEWPECDDVPFGELSERFPNAIPLGIKRKQGEMLICPEPNTKLESGDQILVLAEDDDTYKACPPEIVIAGSLPPISPKSPTIERILMCGWRRDIRDMIQLLDSLVVKGTELHMVNEEPVQMRNKMLQESGLHVDLLKNITLVHHYGNTAIRRHLELLPLDTFTSVMILADASREDDIMHSDSHTLASLLLSRDLQNRMGRANGRQQDAASYSKCICEVLDPRTQRTISTSDTILKLSEFIQSNELVSCILAMISESRDVRVILDELLGADGASFHMEPYSRYCNPDERVSFWQLAKRAMSLGEVLSGYQIRGAIDDTILNPSNKHIPRIWTGIDFIVLRRASREGPLVHHPLPLPIQADDFERTAQGRMSKSSFVRQQILEALVQEQELANIEQVTEQERNLVTRAVRSYVDSSQGAIVRGERGSVQTLISAARTLADTLEQSESSTNSGLQTFRRVSRDESTDEKVSEYDENRSD